MIALVQGQPGSRWELLAHMLLACVVVAIVGLICWAVVVYVVAGKDWSAGAWHRWRHPAPDTAPARITRLPDDPYVVKGTLGGKYEIWDTDMNEVVATAGWAADAARMRAQLASDWYRQQRQLRDAQC